jgi:hypothetical protein
MRTTTPLAVLAASALIGLGAATVSPASGATTTTEKQRGIVLECTGSAHGLSAYASLYENDKHGNVVQVILDDDPDLARSRSPKDDFLVDGKLRTGVSIDGRRATISGTAVRVGPKKHVHEEVDDAGEHIVSDGFHRRLADDLVLRYGTKIVPLECSPAFYYNLTVTREQIEG